MELAYRPAYHDLMAKDVGYDKHSEIVFLDFKLRYYFETERIRLDRANILSITSLNPYDPLFGKSSWRGSLEIDSGPGRGTRVLARIPAAREEEG